MSRPLGSTELKRLHREWRRRTEGRVALVLDDVRGPFNVGAVVRTAAAYRVEHLWLCGETPDLDSAKVGRTAMGCQRFLTWSRCATGAEAVAEAHDQGYTSLGLELADTALPLHEAPLEGDLCLVVGHEDRGLRPATLEACRQLVYLPQLGRVGSLNVATASAIALYELRRRRW